MNKLLFPVFLPALLAALLAGCGSTPVDEKEAGVENRDPNVKTVTAGDLDGRGLPKQLTDPASVLSKRSVYFDLDRYEVRDADRELVTSHARFLSVNRPFKMLIQGNTDERGSREYNLSLGQKRADAVKRMMVLLGVKDEQLESVSLGKEKPSCTESNEDCWSKNRRADMLYKGPTGSGEF